MRIWWLRLIAAVLGVSSAMPAVGQREATDVYIRRMAGLPAETARGQIEIIDVGHDPMSTMLSIVGRRTNSGRVVSYACAASPHCRAGGDHAARTYTLSTKATAEIDQILKRLRDEQEPDGQAPSAGFVGSQLAVKIDYEGFQRQYRRAGLWGKTLGRLEALMSETAT